MKVSDLGVGEDQEALVGQALHDRLRDVLGLDHGARGRHHRRGELVAVERIAEQRGAHAHRAEAARAHATLVVGDRQPLREADRGVLADRVRRRADLRQQPGGRGRGEEVAAAALEPAGQQPLRGEHVGARVDVPAPAPTRPACRGRARRRRRRWRRRGRSARRRPRRARSARPARPDRRRRSRARAPARRARRPPPGALGVEVGHHHAGGALGREAPCERPADPGRRRRSPRTPSPRAPSGGASHVAAR